MRVLPAATACLSLLWFLFPSRSIAAAASVFNRFSAIQTSFNFSLLIDNSVFHLKPRFDSEKQRFCSLNR